MRHLTPGPFALWHSYFGWAAYARQQLGDVPRSVSRDGFMMIFRLPCGCMEWCPVFKEQPGTAYYRVEPMDPT